jgi:hypothetical protein
VPLEYWVEDGERGVGESVICHSKKRMVYVGAISRKTGCLRDCVAHCGDKL